MRTASCGEALGPAQTGLLYALGWQFYKPQREGMVTLLGKLHSLYALGNWIVFHYSVVRVYQACGKLPCYFESAHRQDVAGSNTQSVNNIT
jgi:hypothetical protein